MRNQTQIDIKTRQKHWYNAIPILEAFSCPVNTLSYICFLSITSMIFRATVKSLQFSSAPCVVIDSRQKSFVMNMHLDNALPELSLSDWKKIRKSQIFTGIFDYQKKPGFKNLASKMPS